MIQLGCSIAFTPDAIALRIQDDGQGFDPQLGRGGFGLSGMRHGAIAWVDNSPSAVNLAKERAF